VYCGDLEEGSLRVGARRRARQRVENGFLTSLFTSASGHTLRSATFCPPQNRADPQALSFGKPRRPLAVPSFVRSFARGAVLSPTFQIGGSCVNRSGFETRSGAQSSSPQN